MVYRRRYRRGRKRSTLSKYKIATKTSARAQSRQIYALNRKINNIQRRTRPETKIKWFESNTIQPGAPTEANNSSYVFYGTYSPGTPTIDGQFARLNDMTLYLNASYNTYANTNAPFYLRLVIVQTKTTRGDYLVFNDVFNYNDTLTYPSYTSGGGFIVSNTGNRTAKDSFFGPLASGLGRTARVLCDRKLYLTFQRPTIALKLKLKKLLNYYNVVNNSTGAIGGSEPVAKGLIQAFLLVYNPVTGTGALNLNFDINAKLAYTDA